MDSADNLFMTMNGGISSGSAVVDAVTLHRNVDYYYRNHDSYGERGSDQLNWLNSPGGGEMMIQRRFEADLFSYIKLSSDDRNLMIDKLHKKGIFTAPNGKPIEEYLVDSSTYGPTLTPADFGPETPLSAIPDDTSTLTPAAV
jgi:hypothetical protein